MAVMRGRLRCVVVVADKLACIGAAKGLRAKPIAVVIAVEGVEIPMVGGEGVYRCVE